MAEYLVNILNTKDGGTIDMSGGSQMTFPPETPQLIPTNRKLEDWIEQFEAFSTELQHAISKRLVFFGLPDSPLVKAAQRKRRHEDLTATVAAGLASERKYLRAIGREDAIMAAAPSEAGMYREIGSFPRQETKEDHPTK